MNQSQAKRIASIVFDAAGKAQAELAIAQSEKSLTRFANSIIHQNVSETRTEVSIRLLERRRTARVTTEHTDPQGLRRAVDDCAAIVRAQDADPEMPPLPDPQQYEQTGAYAPATARLDPQARADAAVQVAAKCRATPGYSAAGIYSVDLTDLFVANSKGLFASHRSSRATFSATVTGPSGSGWAQRSSHDASALRPDLVGQTALDKARRNQRPKALPAGRYDVVLEPAAVADLMLFLVRGFSGQAYQERIQWTSGKLGKRVFGRNITIADDAYHPMTRGIPFDFEGIPRSRPELVADGVLSGLVYDRRSARKAKTRTTGHALPLPNSVGALPMDLVVAPGDAAVDEMIASTPKGILVTHFHYVNVIDPKRLILTGMTRDGTFMIRRGKLAEPVKNLRFTESLLNAFSNVVALSAERELASSFWGAALVVPAMNIRDFSFSSETEF